MSNLDLNDPRNAALRPPKANPPDVTNSFEAIARIAAEVPSLPESIFVEHLLPLLAAPPNTRVDLSAWLDIAGTPLRPINITDDNTGAVLFQIPALMRSVPTVLQEEINYHSMVAEALKHEDVAPQLGERYMSQALAQVHLPLHGADLVTARAWNDIRQRYGLPPIGGVNPAVAPSVKTGSDLNSLFADEDE